jgi:preprotein translocase subunit SecA
MLNILKKVFGDKHAKDVKILSPIVAEINAEYEKIKSLSDEELKAKTTEFKERIEQYTAEIRQTIEDLKTRLHSDEEFDRNAAYDELDSL